MVVGEKILFQGSLMSAHQKSTTRAPTMPELLAPAGSFEKLVTAIHYGADAVYLGGGLSLRARAGTFTGDDLMHAVRYAHERGVRVYVTVNSFIHEPDMDKLDNEIENIVKSRADGVIVADPGVLATVKRFAPELSIHLSTQANVTNSGAANFWVGQGVGRINLARELSLADIKRIRKRVSSELEIFVHGAVCISYSGRCLLSHYLTGRDANRGDCAQPCRYSYALVEEKRPGQYFPVEQDEHGTYVFNAKDMCLLEKLPELVAAGVNACKIEGRMRSIFYVGAVVRVYRAALDYLATLPTEAWDDPGRIKIPQHYSDELAKTGTRAASTHFIDGTPDESAMLNDCSRHPQSYEPVAVIKALSPPHVLVEVRNPLHPGEMLEYMGRGLDTKRLQIKTIHNENGELLAKANPGTHARLTFTQPITELESNGLFRRELERRR
jgi:putative protease